MKLFAVTSPKSLGCTFVDWSVHFLSGQEKFYNVNEHEVALTANPLGELNAHGHLRNHPNGLSETQSQIEYLRNNCTLPLASVYPNPLVGDKALAQLGTTAQEMTANQWQNAQEIIVADYQDTVKYCVNQGVSVVYIAPDPALLVYEMTRRSLDRFVFSGAKPYCLDELNKEFESVFFNNSVQTWEKLGLTNIWDQRERQALDIRPLNTMQFSIDHSDPMCWVNCQELFYFGIDAMQKIMRYLDIEIVPERMSVWIPVYRRWQAIQSNSLKFAINLSYIIDAIVNNWYYELGTLSYEQEVIIQHFLIYKHNLNLKTWNLSKFPDNTQQLHSLLEPNIHVVENIY